MSLTFYSNLYHLEYLKFILRAVTPELEDINVRELFFV